VTAKAATRLPSDSRQAFDSKVEVVTREERVDSMFLVFSFSAFALRDLPPPFGGTEWQAHCSTGFDL
jgi:hypothetical protein